MRTALTVTLLACSAALAVAQERPTEQLRKGIVQEEASQDLAKAIKAYQAIVAQYDEERDAVATALFRLAECYRKTGKREEAVSAYHRVIREFSERATLVESSRLQLATAYGVTDRRPGEATTRTSAASAAASGQRTAAWSSLEATRLEIEALERELADVRKRVDAGLIPPAELQKREAQRRLLEVRLQEQLQQRDAREADAREAGALNERLVRSLEKEIALVEQWIAATEARVKQGAEPANSAELLQKRRELLQLQRQLEELRLGLRRQP